MVDQTKSVETLQTEVNQIATDLAEVKKLTDEMLRQSKAEEAVLRAETVAKQVENAKAEATKKLDALKDKTDATSQAERQRLEQEIHKYESMLSALDVSKKDLATLKAQVTVNQPLQIPAVGTTVSAPETQPQAPEKKDNRFKKQRDGVTSKEERKNNTWANVLRVAWGIGAVALVWKWLKRIFGSKKKEKKEAEEKKEKKGFRESGFGKFFKRTGIGTGAYYLIHGFTTGRWNLKDFFNRDKREKLNPEDINERYKNNVPEELKPKYDKFWTNVDEYRKNIGNTDILGKLENEEGKEISIPEWAIPAVMDNAYDNVGEILDTNGDINDKRARAWWKIRWLVETVGGKVVGKLLMPFVGAIKWLKSTFFWSDWEPNEDFKKRAETEDLTRDEQLGNLMQKYTMVRAYLNDKRKQLKRQYIVDQLKKDGISNPTDKQIDDYEQKDDLIEARIKRDFLDRKIVSKDPANSVVNTLEGMNIYDSQRSKETDAVIDEVKDIRKEIISDETVFERTKNSSDINKDEPLRTELGTVSKKFWDHLKEGILHRNILEWIANGFWILNLDELWNSKADDLEEAIDKLWFGDEVKRFRLNNEDFYNKLQNRTLTKNDIIKFETTINEYFSLLQQVMLEVQSQQENEWSWEWGTWFLWRMRYLVSTPTWWVLMWSAFVLSKSKIVRRATKGAIKFTFGTIAKPTKRLLRSSSRKMNMPFSIWNKYLKLASYGETLAWYDNFTNDFKKGSMSFDEARYVFNKRKTKWNQTGYFSDFLEKEIKLNNQQIRMLEGYMNNKNIRKILSKNSDVTLGKLADRLKVYDTKFESLAKERKTLCKALLNHSELKGLDDIDIITKNIDAIDVTGLSPKQINQLAKDIGKDISILSDPAKVATKIDEVKKWAEAAVDVIKNLTPEQKAVYKLLDDDIKELRTTIKNLNLDVTSMTGKYYMKQVEGIEQFQKKITAFTVDEVEAFNALRKLEFKSYHIVEMFELKKIAAIGGEIGKIEKWVTDLAGLARQLRSSKDAWAEISESLIKTIDDIHAKNLLKSADEVGIFIKNIFKFISKIT